MLKSAVAALAAILLAASCAKPPAPIGSLVEEFVYGMLALSPVTATGAGYHVHQGVKLDEKLDGYSKADIDAQRRFLVSFREKTKAIPPDSLNPSDRADNDMINGQIDASLLDLDLLQGYKHNPTLYVELIGNALFAPFVLEYEPEGHRFLQIVERLKRIPALLDQAKANLVDSPELWIEVAIGENDGNIDLIEKTLAEKVPEGLEEKYQAAAKPAADALRAFSKYLKDDLSKKPADWRLGKEKFALKFKAVLATDQTPEQVLADAEATLKTYRAQMERLSQDTGGDVKKKLSRIAEKHSRREDYFKDAAADLDSIRAFLRERKILPLPTRDNLKVIPTPEFMRGIYSVGGFNPAPSLEPQLGAFYWLTPIPKEWPKERVESKLREYNFYGLKLLSIHEALPGHYVQAEFGNEIEPKGARLLRGVFGNGPYVEGWAVYATEATIDAGYLGNDPNLRMQFLKQQLRMISNTILDVRMHTMGMTDEQALSLMIGDTFQQREEAMGKLQRAKLSSCQLSTYFVGWRDWRRLLDHAKAVEGDKFNLSQFHERALRAGALPLPVLSRLLTGKALPVPLR